MWPMFHCKSVLGFWIHPSYGRDLMGKPRAGGRNLQCFCFEGIFEIQLLCFLRTVMNIKILIFLNALNAFKAV